MTSILICLPTMHRMLDSGTGIATANLMQTLLAHDIGCEIRTIDSTEIVTARDYFANSLLYSSHDALLFIDADMEFSPDIVLRMVGTGGDVVGVICPKRLFSIERFWEAARDQADIRRCIASALEWSGHFDWDRQDAAPARAEYGFAPAASVGMALTLITKKALRDMIEAGVVEVREDMSASGQPCYSFFDLIHDRELKLRLSEDVSFCHRWTRQMNRELLACIDAEISHVGPFAYKGRYSDLLG